VARSVRNSAWNEVFALILLGAGTLLFLALISYVPKDLPSWVPFSHLSPPNSPAQNFIGPLGAIVAGFCYFMIGGASYLLAVALLGFGAAKLFYSQLRVSSRALWIALFVVSGACLLHLQTRWLQDWPAAFNIQGPGGWVGYFFGKSVLQRLLGAVGSLILIGGVYVSSLVLMTGLRPIHIVRETVAGIRRGVVRFREWRLNRELRATDLKGQLEISQRELAKRQRTIEKQLKKKGAPVPEPPAGSFISAEELADRPKPKVVDTTALPEDGVAARKKPSLAELRKGDKAKAAAGGGLTTPAWDGENYTLPGLELLAEHDVEGRVAVDPAELERIQMTLIDTLGQFGIAVAPGDITKGPTITRYEVYPAKGVRVDKIVSLERDLARATRAERINILAPIPGKDTVGIELANSRKVKVTLRELMQSPDWTETKAKLPIALGKDVYGKTIIADLAQMPHLLVAGTTGSGKSVCINSLIASMLYRFTPEELRFIMIDPKVVEMQVYNELPHLIIPVVTDPKKVLLALRHVILEMENRYKIFAKSGVRNITSFNARPPKKTQKQLDLELASVAAGVSPAQRGAADTAATTEPPVGSVDEYTQKLNITVPRDDEPIIPDKLPYIVVIIDELADLMQTAPADVESAIARITQMARAAGIHLIVATQTPRADVITGVIKANIPSRIAFQVASKIDSRVILDENGADRLLGQGDMLYLPPSTSRLIRAQGVLVTDEEIRRLVEFVSAQSPPSYDTAIHEKISSGASGDEAEEVTEEDEELVEKCLEIIRQEKRASTSLLQRRLRLGYTRAARIVDILEQRGILGPGEGAKPREILVDLDAAV
jgi:DNA segregation ATPase FtsK/SpoIIIE, S-DNA-T family